MKTFHILENIFVRAATIGTRLLPRRLWLRIREETAITGCMDYQRDPIYICLDSCIESEIRLNSCAKEPATVKWIETYFQPGDVFYDIGANNGAYSLIGFKFLKGNVKIYAFEPGFVTFPQLCRNVYLNNAANVIVPLQVALSDETSITAFHYENLITGGALHALKTPVDYRGKPFQPVVTMPTLNYRLDDFVQQFGLRSPNHIKIDVDGIEYEVLKGAQETLSSPELRSVLLEINEERGDGDEIRELVRKSGFVMESELAGESLYCRKDVLV